MGLYKEYICGTIWEKIGWVVRMMVDILENGRIVKCKGEVLL